jgi:hypothetical protein
MNSKKLWVPSKKLLNQQATSSLEHEQEILKSLTYVCSCSCENCHKFKQLYLEEKSMVLVLSESLEAEERKVILGLKLKDELEENLVKEMESIMISLDYERNKNIELISTIENERKLRIEELYRREHAMKEYDSILTEKKELWNDIIKLKKEYDITAIENSFLKGEKFIHSFVYLHHIY